MKEFLAILKTGGYISIIMMFGWLQIPTMQIGILSALMLLDFLAGIGKWLRIDYKNISSHKMWVGVMKKIATFVSILSIALVARGLGFDAHNYVTIVLSIFIVSEGYSILQNVYSIRTGKIVEEYDVISIAIKRIGDLFIKYIDTRFSVLEEETINKKNISPKKK